MRTIAKVFCITSILMVLWLFAAVVFVEDASPRTGTPEWLTLEHRQKVNFKQHTGE